MQIIVMIRGKKKPINKSQNRESIMRTVPKTIRKCKNEQQKRRCPCSTPLYLKVNAEEIHSPGKLTQVGMVENVHSTRINREFCKPTTKSYSNTTPKKGLVQFRDGNDMWRWWYFELKTLAVLKTSKVQMRKFPQKLRDTFLFKMKVVAF